MCEFLEDVASSGGHGLVFDNPFVDHLNVRGVIRGEDGGVGGELCKDLVWGVVFLVDFDDGGSGSGHASAARRKEQIETFCHFLGFLCAWGS